MHSHTLRSVCGVSGFNCAFARHLSAREESAITTLLAFLGTNVGDGPAAPVCSPDVLPHCVWTNDWVIAISGDVWRIDHTRLTWSEDSIPRMRELESHLKPTLQVLAEEFGVRLAVMMTPDVGADFQERAEFRQVVYSVLRQVLKEGSPWTLFDPISFVGPRGAQIQILQESHPSAIGAVTLGTSMARTSNLADQFDMTVGVSLRNKLRKQLAKDPARSEQVGILLDRAHVDGEPETSMIISNGVLSHDSLTAGIRRLVVETPGALDRVWLRDSDGSLCELWSASSH